MDPFFSLFCNLDITENNFVGILLPIKTKEAILLDLGFYWI